MAALTDPIADMLTRIRNAILAGHHKLELPASKIKKQMAEILQEEGFIASFSSQPSSPQETLHLDLKYIPGGDNAIHGLKRVSTPGCRVYKGFRELSQIRNGLGIAILSTSQGVMSDRKARKLHVGGEILCYIW